MLKKDKNINVNENEEPKVLNIEKEDTWYDPSAFHQYLGFNSTEDIEAFESECCPVGEYNYNSWMKEEVYEFESKVVHPTEEEYTEILTLKRATYKDMDDIYRMYMNNLMAIEDLGVKEEKVEDVVLDTIALIYVGGCFYTLRNPKGRLVGVFSVHLGKEIAGVDATPVIKNIAMEDAYVTGMAEAVHKIATGIRAATKALAMSLVILVRRENDLMNMAISKLFHVSPRKVREHPETFLYICMFSNSKSLNMEKNNGMFKKMLKQQSDSYKGLLAKRKADLEKHLPEHLIKKYKIN